MEKLLVTGGAGFIGSNFIRETLGRENGLLLLVNLDLLTYAGNPENLGPAREDPRYRFVQGDIRDRALVEGLFRKYDFDTVVHFAAESHVDRSILNPEPFLSTNILGSQVLLEAARRHWTLGSAYRPGVRFLHISTDEVYGALGASGRFTEESPLAPNSPYSASKAAGDLMVRAYCQTYGMPAVITRCSNNYGPCQHPEKLIPRMIRRAMADLPLPVYGDGSQVREWIHVKDHCAALTAVLDCGQPGEIYNIGGGSERTNLEIVRLILAALGKPESLIAYVKDRPGHDWRYALGCGKISAQLGWAPVYSFEEGIVETIRWYLDHPGRGEISSPLV